MSYIEHNSRYIRNLKKNLFPFISLMKHFFLQFFINTRESIIRKIIRAQIFQLLFHGTV